jgi:hypothetical protein
MGPPTNRQLQVRRNILKRPNPAETTARLDSDLLTEAQAQQQELPMSLAWYRRRRWLRYDGPPVIRIGNRCFYRRGDLRAWIAAQERRP